MKNRDVMKRPYQKFLFFMCDRPAVDDTGDHCRQHLGKPEGVPCAVCAQPVTQQCSQPSSLAMDFAKLIIPAFEAE